MKSVFEAGEEPEDPGATGGAAERERWRIAREAAINNDMGLVDDQIFVCHYSSLVSIAKDHMTLPTELDDVCGVWLYGEAGAGKSFKARQDYPGAYLKMCNKWWDGYKLEPYVIIDDIDVSHKVLGHHLKIWADRYPFVAERKGGAIAIRPRVVCVTSQYSIEEIWSGDKETIDALKRRFKCVRLGLPRDAPEVLKKFVSPKRNVIDLTGDKPTETIDLTIGSTPVPKHPDTPIIPPAPKLQRTRRVYAPVCDTEEEEEEQ